MKLQNLAIIFIVIIIPIIFIFSFYLKLETKTISMQTDYDEKLIEATKEAIEAFEINTVEWSNEYSTLANSKRQDLMASINVFTTGLANKLGISGASKESILTYVPAIVYTMYDGYYIYTPTYVPQTITDEEGKQCFYYKDADDDTKVTISATQNIGGTIYAGEPMYVGEGLTATYKGSGITFTTDIEEAEKTYKHVLKTFVPYTANVELDGKDYVINYTLDNYVRIYGKENENEGYIIEDFGDDNSIIIPENSISEIKFNDTLIQPEILTENIPVKNDDGTIEVRTFRYIYNSNNDKRYYDADKNKFFALDKNYNKMYLADTTVGTTIAEYKNVSICVDRNSGSYVELYQLLNGDDDIWYYKDYDNKFESYSYPLIINKEKDCSAVNYYVETYCFNKWLTGLMDKDEIQNIIDGKKQAIINNINNNLNLSMSNYSANSKINYKLPELTDEDWEQALSNISMITFLQGQKIGLKTYNNYVVVTSTSNNEYINEDSLYFLGDNRDEYYHRYNCKAIKQEAYKAYRNTEFKAQIVGNNIYYKHNSYFEGNKYDQLECFECIVNRNNIDDNIQDEYLVAQKTGLARERYIQKQRTRLTEKNSLKALTVSHTITTLGEQKKINLNIKGGSGNYIIVWASLDPDNFRWSEDDTKYNKKEIMGNIYISYRYVVYDTETGEHSLGFI